MPYILEAPALLDKRYLAGHIARVFPVRRISGKWSYNAYHVLRRPRISCRIISGCRNSLAGSSTSSWLPIDPILEHDDVAYGGWSHGGTSIQGEKKKGILYLIFIGGRTSLAICLAILVSLAFFKKGFMARLCAPVAGTYQLFTPLIPRFTLLGPTKTFEHTFPAAEKAMYSKSEDKNERERDFDDSFPAAEKCMPRKLENKDQRYSDSEATETEVSRVTETKPGKMLIPAVIDSAQWEAVSALQKLKIVESHIQPGELCTRREYARWLISANSVFSRNQSYRVFPSVFIEGVTVLAFDDIETQDPDFPYIQGLAEAGVIPSKLSLNNQNFTDDDQKQGHTFTMFYPENHLSRVDLLTWKMFADYKNLPEVDRRTLEKKSGLLDVERISIDAWPAVFMDALAGDKSVTAKAFGYSRRFQPDKHVTKGQALIAISSGRVAAVVSEELSRLEAENSAKEAVLQEILSEMISRGEIKAFWEKDLDQAKQQRTEAEKILDVAVNELKREKAEEERRKASLLKEIAQLEFEHQFLSNLQNEVFELEKAIMSEEIDIRFDKEYLEELKTESEVELEALSIEKSLAETEKKALILSRLWVEDEARRIQVQSEILQEAVKRWKFTESSTCSCWCHQKDGTREDVPEGGGKTSHVSLHELFPSNKHVAPNSLQQNAVKSFGGFEDGAEDLQNVLFSNANEKAN